MPYMLELVTFKNGIHRFIDYFEDIEEPYPGTFPGVYICYRNNTKDRIDIDARSFEVRRKFEISDDIYREKLLEMNYNKLTTL